MFYIIKVGTITNAQRAKYALGAKGMKSTVSRLKNPKGSDGCGYIVQLNTDDIERALRIVQNENINIRGVERL